MGFFDMKSILLFDTMMTPKIITLVYWISLSGVLAVGVGSMFYGAVIRGLVGILAGMLTVRITFEVVIISFKNNEYLKKIVDKL